MALQFDNLAESANETSDNNKGGTSGSITLPWMTKRASNADRMFFTEQLSLLLETGESLHGALQTLTEQTESPAMREIVERIVADIGEGKSFAFALARHEGVFSTTYVNLIAASENGGFMHEVLQELLKMDHKREELRSTLVSAATYPMFLIFFSFAVVVFVLVVVFPKFGDMFHSIYDQLPATTKVLMSLSETLRQHSIVIGAGFVALFLGLRHWLQSTAGREKMDYLKLHLPGISSIFVQVYLVQTLQALSLSLGNGVSVMESLDACKDVVKNSHFRRLLADVQEKVQEGAGVAAGFADADYLPLLARHMIATGEQTGNLAKVMGRVSEYYEKQLANKLEAVSKLAEPVMLLVMGVVVGVLVSSLILPIFKLSRAVG